MKPDTEWAKSSHSAMNGNCVQARWQRATACNWDKETWCTEAKLGPSGHVLVRDSKLGDASPVLDFTPDEWRAFVAGVKDGEFDLLSGD